MSSTVPYLTIHVPTDIYTLVHNQEVQAVGFKGRNYYSVVCLSNDLRTRMRNILLDALHSAKTGENGMFDFEIVLYKSEGIFARGKWTILTRPLIPYSSIAEEI